MEKHRIVVGTEEGMITPEHRAKQIEAEANDEAKEREEAKQSPYKKWVQWNSEHHMDEDRLIKESPMAFRVWKFLVHNMDRYNAVMCSYQVLIEVLQASKDTIYRAIRLLKNRKYIAVLKSGAANIYALNHDLVWNSHGYNMEYSKFPVNVILSLSEQEEEVQIKATRQKQLEVKEEKGRELKKGKEKGTPQGSQSQRQLMESFLRPM